MDKELWLTSRNLGLNLIELRRARRLSQEELAKSAGLPRSTLTYLESGHGNPSLHNIVKIANALQVRIEEILSHRRTEVRLFHEQDIPRKKGVGGQVMVSKLLPDPIPGMEIEKLDFEPVQRMKGTPHIKNTKEYFYCIKGEVTVHVGGQRHKVPKGALLAFPGDQAHGYENTGRGSAVGFSVVSLAY